MGCKHGIEGVCTKCTDAATLAAKDAEIERLRAALVKANEQAERFERGWYLRGDALEQARGALQKTMAAWGGTCAWHADVKAAIAAIDGLRA
jgi:cell division protein FtsB